MSWSKVAIDIPDVGAGTLATLIEKIREYLELLTGVLRTISKFLKSINDPLSAVLEALISELEELVSSFLADVGGYVLFVPVRKRLMTNFLGLGDVTPSWAGDLGIFGQTTSAIGYNDPAVNEFLTDANRFNGGNAGFFSTVVDSLYDEGDTNRPQFFEDEDYIGGLVLVAGTNADPLGFLDDMWKLSGIFDAPDPMPKVPRPSGLEVRTIDGIGGGTFNALLTWDAPDTPVYKLEDLGGVVLYPSRYAIIRAKNQTESLTAQTVIDLMGTRELSQGDTFANGGVEVILEDEYNLTKVSYLDEGVPATDEDVYYYAVAWQLKAFGAKEEITADGGVDLDYWHISNVARAVPFPTLPGSTPPDWKRTPSVAKIFPQFAALLERLTALISAFAARLQSPSTVLDNYIQFLENEITRYESIAASILNDIAKLESKFQLPTAGLYARTFQGQGGNTYFISDLAKGFSQNDPDRPPFTRGDEFVTGAVLLAGGRQPDVTAFIEALSWVFGTASNDGSAETLESLGAAVGQIEDTYFGPDLEPATEPEETSTTESDILTSTVRKTDCPGSGAPDTTTVTFNANMGVSDADA